jgi:DNA-binding SARP family transcriptional activator
MEAGMADPNVMPALLTVPTPEPPELHLFAGPYVVLGGRRREVPEGSKRLLVYVALQGGQVDRKAVAGTLWPVGDDARAAGNLRSALWRLRGAGIDVLESTPSWLRVRTDVVVDLEVRSAWAMRLTEGRACADDLREDVWRSVTLDLLSSWDEDWVVFERERLRQRVLHGLEALSRLLVCSGRLPQAVEVAAATVRADPLRESAQRVLIEAHLARGDLDLARQHYDLFRALLDSRLRVGATAALSALVAGWPRPPAPRRTEPEGPGPRAAATPAPRRPTGDQSGAPVARTLVLPGSRRLQ